MKHIDRPQITSLRYRWRPMLAALAAAALVAGSSLAQTPSQQAAPVLEPGAANIEVVDAATARKQLRALSQGLKSLQAQFTQYQPTASGDKKDLNSGTLALKAPNRFRWHYRQPQEQLIIATGQEILIYDPDLEQLTVKPQSNDHNPLYVLFNPDLIDKHYRITNSFRRQGLLWVKIIPLQPQDNVQAVWLGINTDAKRLEQIQMRDNLDQIVVFEFSQIRRNPPVSDDLFRFTPPQGTDVVRDQPAAGEF